MCGLPALSLSPLPPFPSSLKVEYDKLANEKTEMQRHYVMVRASRKLRLQGACGESRSRDNVHAGGWCVCEM